MLPIYHILLPTPYPVGPVNIYLILSEPYTLIDAGPDTDEARAVLEKALAERDLSLSDLKRVVLTHAHSDHSGLADWLHRVSGARIFLHPFELAKLIRPQNFFDDRLAFLAETGCPLTAIQEMLAARDRLPHPRVSEDCAVTLRGGEGLSFEEGVLQVFHLPGHAQGHLCLYDREGGHFFAGDFLLPHITPNPVAEFDPGQPGKRIKVLSFYLQGLERINGLEITTVWPGHGEAFSDHRRLIAAYRAHHESRLRYILELLRTRGELTVYQLTRLAFPDLKGFAIFLGLSEIQAHVDLLQDRGLVAARKQDKVLYYRAWD